MSKHSSARIKNGFQKNALGRYQDLSEEEKKKKQEYVREWYKHLSQHEKKG